MLNKIVSYLYFYVLFVLQSKTTNELPARVVI